MNKQLKKIEIPYTLKGKGATVKVFKDKKQVAITVEGIASALEAIFIIENMTKKNWLICEDEKVFLVDRAEWEIAEDRENLIEVNDKVMGIRMKENDEQNKVIPYLKKIIGVNNEA